MVASGGFSYVVVQVAGHLVKIFGFGLFLLRWLGFSAAGPVAGSTAACAQSYIGNVAGGSIFALIQKMCMP